MPETSPQHRADIRERDHPSQDQWAELRDLIDNLSGELALMVAQACPGAHMPTQHRDARPPWCNHCRRDDRGVEYAPRVAKYKGLASPDRQDQPDDEDHDQREDHPLPPLPHGAQSWLRGPHPAQGHAPVPKRGPQA